MNLPVRIALVTITMALVGIAVVAMVDAPAEMTNAPPPEVRPQAYATLPPVNPGDARSIMERSPFIQGRAPFDRQAALTPPPPPLEVRLTGIFKLGKELRATLLIGGQSISVRKGDETLIGKVASIEATAVVIEGPTPHRLEMFKQ